MAWLFLICAGLFEIGWPLGLKLATQPGKAVLGSTLAIIFMAASGFLLYLAQKTIPMGTAYAIWTGIGAAGAFLVGVIFFQDTLTFWRALGAILIVSGVIVLKLATH